MLAALSADPGLRQELAEKGLRRSRSYSWEAAARQQLMLYRSVMSGHDRASPASGDSTGPVQDLPALEVVVVAYGRPDLLAETLDALCSDGPSGIPILVVDNSSSPDVQKVAESHGARCLDPGMNLGFARAVNLALAHLKREGSDVLLLNPDAQVDPTTVHALQRRLHAESRLACVAPAQDSPEGESQRVAWPFPSPARSWLEAFGLAHLLDKPEFLIGSVLMINGAALREVGGFDEDFFLYAEETDWQRRARGAGWGHRLCDDLRARHIGAATSSQDPSRRELLFSGAQERYLRKWYGRSGWELARAAIVVGSLARTLLLSGGRREAALDRARRFAAGPLRLMANEPGQP